MKIFKDFIDQIEDDEYFRLKEFKYIQFNRSFSFVGGAHYRITKSPAPNWFTGKVYNIVPMQSRVALLKYLQYQLDNPELLARIKNPEVPLSKDEIEDYLFGEHSDNYNRLSKFYEIENKISAEDYNDLFRRVYVSCAKNYHYRIELRNTFSNKISIEGNFMTDEEKEVFNDLPDKVKIYRVMSRKEAESKDYGVSWTLDKNIAKQIGKAYFPGIYFISGFRVQEKEIDKSDLAAFLNHDERLEVIYLG